MALRREPLGSTAQRHLAMTKWALGHGGALRVGLGAQPCGGSDIRMTGLRPTRETRAPESAGSIVARACQSPISDTHRP
jgi:hypothetical protein